MVNTRQTADDSANHGCGMRGWLVKSDESVRLGSGKMDGWWEKKEYKSRVKVPSTTGNYWHAALPLS